MEKEELEELKKRNRTRITITIQPTNTKDEDGYRTGLVTVFKDEGIGTEKVELEHWQCDSFSIEGHVQCDFEADGGIKLWSNSKQLKVSPGYGTRIYGYGAENYDLHMDVIDMFSEDSHIE